MGAKHKYKRSRIQAIIELFDASRPIERRNYYLTYTVVFAIIACMVFGWFVLARRSNVWTPDTITQDYANLLYLRALFSEVLEEFAQTGVLSFPTWDMRLGHGENVSMVLGMRPWLLPSLLVPENALEALSWFRLVLSLYLSGCGFSLLCKKLTNQYTLSILTGSLVYLFGGAFLYYIIKHPVFYDLLLYLPFLLFGAEKILRDETPILFVLLVALCGSSYFYSLYVITLVGIVFILLESITIVRPLRIQLTKALKNLGRISLWYLLGLGIACFSFLPSVMLGLDAARGISTPLEAFYGWEYYINLFLGLIGPTQIGLLGYIALPASVFVVIIFSVFNKPRRNVKLLIATILCLLGFIFPITARIFNGFSGSANRWCVVIPFVAGLLIATELPKLGFPSKPKPVFIKLCLAISLYAFGVFALAWMGFDVTGNHVVFLIPALGIVAYALFFSSKHATSLLSLLICIELVFAGAYAFSGTDNAFIKEFVSQGMVLNDTRDVPARVAPDTAQLSRVDAIASNYLINDQYYNYGTRGLTPGLGTFYSYSPASMNQAVRELGISQAINTLIIKNFDQRTVLDELSAVRYLTADTGGESTNHAIPFGFIKIDELEGIEVYENLYRLPLMYAYDNIVGRDDFSSMSPNEREWSMLQGAVFEDIPEGTIDVSFSYDSESKREVLYDKLEEAGAISDSSGGFQFETPITVEIPVTIPAGCEAYVQLHDMGYRSFTRNEVIEQKVKGANDSRIARFNAMRSGVTGGISTNGYITAFADELDGAIGPKKIVRIVGETDMYYDGEHDYLINLGYSETERNLVTITFSSGGIYSFSDFEIVCQPMDKYVNYVRAIHQADSVELTSNGAVGKITASDGDALCFAVPYASGWSAKVNGKPVKIHQTNVEYMGVFLEKGENTVEFTYETPGGRLGLLITSISVLLTIGAILLRRRHFRKKDHH